MAEILIKLQSKDLNIELQGENEIVEKIFNDLRLNGIGKLEEKSISVTEDHLNINKAQCKDIKENKIYKIKTEKRNKQNQSKKYEYIELNFSKKDIEDLEEFFSKANAKTIQNQVLVLMYWYNKNKKSENFDVSFNSNLIYTLYKNLNITKTANLEQIRRNLLTRTSYIKTNKEIKDEFILSINGQKYVEDLIKGKNE